MRPEDFPEVHQMRSDPDIARFMGFTPYTEVDKTINYINSMLNGMDAGEWLFWSITRKGEDRFIGSIVLWNYRSRHNDAELGYSLLPSHQRHGYMSEALPLVMDYAYSALKLDNLHALTGTDNFPSRFLLEKLAFFYIADVSEEMPNGKVMNMVDYIMSKEDFYTICCPLLGGK